MLTLASSIDIREPSAAEKSKSVANMYRSSLLLNSKYKTVIEDLGLLSEVTVSPSQVENEVKLWKMGTTDASGNPICARTLQLTPSTSVEVITALAVSDENDTLCIGCQSGTTAQYYIQGDLDDPEGFGFAGLPATAKGYDNGSLAVQDMMNGNIKYVIIDAAPAAAIAEAMNANA